MEPEVQRAKVITLGIQELTPCEVEALCQWVEAQAQYIREQSQNLGKTYTARMFMTEGGGE